MRTHWVLFLRPCIFKDLCTCGQVTTKYLNLKAKDLDKCPQGSLRTRTCPRGLQEWLVHSSALIGCGHDQYTISKVKKFLERIWSDQSVLFRGLIIKSSYLLDCAATHCWPAPLEVRTAKHRHQSREWTFLSHVKCFIQGEARPIGFQVLLDSLHPRSTRTSLWSVPFLQGEAVKLFGTNVLFYDDWLNHLCLPTLELCRLHLDLI